MTSDKHKTGNDLEGTMKRVSQVLSMIGFGLMAAGLAVMLFSGASFSSMEISALGIFPFSQWGRAPLGLAITSAGIILLGLLPLVRVAMALWLYARQRDLLDTAATVVVFLELLLSIRLG
jgi:uncharacterized membrane protein